MKRSITQPCVVLGSADRAAILRDDLARRGVRFVSFARSVGQLRRQLVLGEDASLLLCVLLSVDDLTLTDRQHVARLLADRPGFATRVFCVGVIGASEDFTRWAPLGCDAYVPDSAQAFDVIRAYVRTNMPAEVATAEHLMSESVAPMLDDQLMHQRPASGASVHRLRSKARRKQLRISRARPVGWASEPRGGQSPPA